jgi:peptidoglycan/LPS O-acetylase OafA/YrhL
MRVLSEFIFGMLIFQLYRLNFKAPFWLFAIVSALIIVYMSVINTHSRWDWVMVLTFGVLIYALTNSEHGVSRFLASANMKYLGEISYSIYLCHGVVFMVFNSALPKLLPSGEGIFLLIPVLIYVVVTLIVAHYMYKLVEIPAQAYLKKRL